MEKHIFEIKNLNIYYHDFQAVKNVSVAIPSYVITAIIGPSGCGKSSFLRSMNRMNDLIPNAKLTGEILFHGVNIYDPLISEVNLRRRVGMVFQKPNPFPFSIFANVAYGLKIQNIKDKAMIAERVEESLKRAFLWDEVKDRLKKPALELSGGQQQRLCIARALAVYPDTLLLDEPCSSLDPLATAKIEELLQKLKKEVNIIIVTHNLQQAKRISEYVGFFNSGELVDFGPTKEIFERSAQSMVGRYIQGIFG
ncbi:MAG: phosphate ABC transporter ATP-binding protein [Candidatus Staskawiczbacteria bacterium RIFCSPLOWO2_01_FULL_38_12b]|uniref:Phosphate ABC transporter ATP-binding protein n=1 Tax=Candidatus Staskawiczbacteria bacterium RIFCSPLOWO2_01_FULL_38_12b TaxID=1802214 RepID=A0A1G2III0_9BACT|nr:MAG: phosphate ABC transporter ATP-binding protein [Candidatus Staskawiczbacteria bacterium RIFCSPLOWO2_01_FULL_38_12b]